MPLPLNHDQSQIAEGLHHAGEHRYGEEPVLVGQLRKDPRTGWELRAIPIRQKVARQIMRILEAEKAILDSGDPLRKVKPAQVAKVKRKKWTGMFDF